MIPSLKSEPDVNTLLEFALDLAEESGRVLMNYFGNLSEVKHKSIIDLVTDADTESENLIISKINKKFPQHDIITEEQDLELKNSPFRWIVDPLDGTTNFVHGLPIFAVSIALKYKGITILGVVFNPARIELYHAIQGNGSFKNGDKITVSATAKLQDSLLVTGFPYDHNDEWQLCFSLFQELYGMTQGIRRLGAAALDFCSVAEGAFDGFYEINLKPWDIAAGDIIVREAGGITSGWNGNELPESGKRVLATNGKIHKEILSSLDQEKFKILTAPE